MKIKFYFILCGLIGTLGLFSGPCFAQSTLEDFCRDSFTRSKNCPVSVCKMQCANETTSIEECEPVCLPKACDQIALADCPIQYCDVMEDCAGEKICHFKMMDSPACGDLAYAGQNVECCDGLVKRCGVEFFDHTCDMEGKKSAYNLPICIPCGDGLCGQFENRCNCPEDCVPENTQR